MNIEFIEATIFRDTFSRPDKINLLNTAIENGLIKASRISSLLNTYCSQLHDSDYYHHIYHTYCQDEPIGMRLQIINNRLKGNPVPESDELWNDLNEIFENEPITSVPFDLEFALVLTPQLFDKYANIYDLSSTDIFVRLLGGSRYYYHGVHIVTILSNIIENSDLSVIDTKTLTNVYSLRIQHKTESKIMICIVVTFLPEHIQRLIKEELQSRDDLNENIISYILQNNCTDAEYISTFLPRLSDLDEDMSFIIMMIIGKYTRYDNMTLISDDSDPINLDGFGKMYDIVYNIIHFI